MKINSYGVCFIIFLGIVALNGCAQKPPKPYKQCYGLAYDASGNAVLVTEN